MHAEQQAVGLERFLDEIVSAELDRLNRGLDVAVAADHDDRQIAIARHDLPQQADAVDPTALQPDVEQYQARLASADFRKRAIRVPRLSRFIPFVG